MARAANQEPPDEGALRKGLLGALGLYIEEADLSRAPGETGFINVTIQVALDHGRVRFTKGSVFFERRIDIGGRP